MKFYIEWGYNAQREISEAVYTAIATATREKANEIVYNVLGGKPEGWRLSCK